MPILRTINILPGEYLFYTLRYISEDESLEIDPMYSSVFPGSREDITLIYLYLYSDIFNNIYTPENGTLGINSSDRLTDLFSRPDMLDFLHDWFVLNLSDIKDRGILTKKNMFYDLCSYVASTFS